MALSDYVPRWLVFVVTVVVVAGALSVPGMLASPPNQDPVADTDTEYAVEDLVADRTEAEGAVNPLVPEQREYVVVVDAAHANRFESESLSRMLGAVVATGGEVRFHETGDDINESLDGANAFVVVDPGSGYTAEEADAVGAFADAGGHVLLAGEPTRRVVALGLTTQRSRLTTVGSELGVAFGTEYLYNQQRNDGNYRHVFATPTASAQGEYVEGVLETTAYTATTVRTDNGTPLLTVTESTRLAGSEATGRYAIAAVTGDGSTVALGDASFLADGRFNVADNEEFIERLVEFLSDGEASYDPPEGDEDGSFGEDDEETPSGTTGEPATP